jgi:hypothetical protein
MQADLLIDAILLAAVLEADLGAHRKVGKFRILRPIGVAAAIIPLYVKAIATTGTGLTLELAVGAARIVLGLIATALMTVYRSPKTGQPVSRAGLAYGALWTLVIGARAAFSYGSIHWFGPQLTRWMTQHAVTSAAITDALILMAVTMLMTRVIGLAVRATSLTTTPESVSAPQKVGV